MTAVPRVPSIASVLTFAAGAVIAGAIFGLTFVLESQSRDATRELERQTTIVAAVGRLGRTIDLMMAIPRIPGVPPEYLVKENAGRRRDYEEALERVKRLTADEAEIGAAAAATRLTSVERSVDEWQRAVTVPQLQGRKASGKPEEGINRAAHARDELRALETDCLDVLGSRRSALDKIAVRERMVGRWLAGTVALGLVVACALRWRVAWSGAPS
jgi:CHASE3 domain sensor protein